MAPSLKKARGSATWRSWPGPREAGDPPLLGRQLAFGRILSLVEGAVDGHGGALVVRGEAGIGKTALIAQAVRDAPRLDTLFTSCAEFEMELPFAALHQLLAPVLDRVAALPHPQRAALDAAFGMTCDAPPDRFLVGLAVLGLLSDCGQQQPIICVIDDAHWLDNASTHVLLFAARRLESEHVAMLFSMRDTSVGLEFDAWSTTALWSSKTSCGTWGLAGRRLWQRSRAPRAGLRGNHDPIWSSAAP